MDDELLARTRAWMENDPDAATVAELRALVDRGAVAELSERMSGPLEFGTAGLRGLLGGGESRMNRAVVRRTAAGLAKYLRASLGEAATAGVVIGYDARHMSRAFAEDTAAVLAQAGIVAHVFGAPVPTPLAAFAITHLNAAAGVVVTASHNPREYNGYKVYWGNGAQITPPHDKGIAKAIKGVGPARFVSQMAEPEAREAGLWRDVDPSVRESYHDALAALSLDGRGRDKVKIVYTPLHGVGDIDARAVLTRYGFADVRTVAEQQAPDPTFPTVPFPNPEEAGALDLALALAAREGATLVLANDPDADRLAVAVPQAGGGYRQLTGNEVGALLADYLLRASTSVGGRRLVITTVVSSPMLSVMATAFGVRYAEVLTGFKWIATTAMRLEREQNAHFVVGYEEALGYTIGSVVRDKDGVGAAALFAELVAVAADHGKSVDDELERLARSYGLFVSAQHNVTKKGKSGAAAIDAMMEKLRETVGTDIGRARVEAFCDLRDGTRRTSLGTTLLELPKSNVLVYELEGGARVIARPSGTEPKVKFYFDVREPVTEGEAFDSARARAVARLEALRKAFLAVAGER